jgi:hypothetical protein
MFRKLKTFLVAVAAINAMAVDMQTTQDYADGNRLVINGKPVFISGMNIAWNNFARDVGDNAVSITAFVNQFKQIKGAGGNAVRWWLHTDGQNDPKFNESTGAVTGLGSRTISNIRQVLDSAYAYGIVVSLTLFSFDLLNNDGNNKTAAQMERNKKFLTEPANLDSYITNALKPMLQAVGSHPAIMCWEVFNEPEGMSSDAGGWSKPENMQIAMSHILRFTAKIAAEVHRSTKKMASTGIHEYGKMKTHYSDSKLKTASGTNDADAYLDFYMAHYYPQYIGTSGSPFHHPASYWGMDRPILIGEFPAQSWGNGSSYGTIQDGTAMTITAAYEYAYDNGYCGAMSWSMTEGEKDKFGSFTTTEPALKNLYNKHKDDINILDKDIVVPTGDLAMKLALTNLPKEGTDSDGGPWNELAIEQGTLDFSGKTNFTFEMYVEPGSGKNLMIVPVIKMGSDWTWSPAQTEQFSLTNITQGEWVTITIPISAFKPESGSPQLSQIKGVVLQYFAKDSPYTGTILFDNVKVDNTALFNFNEPGSEWNTTADGASVSLVAKSGGGSPSSSSRSVSSSSGGSQLSSSSRASSSSAAVLSSSSRASSSSAAAVSSSSRASSSSAAVLSSSSSSGGENQPSSSGGGGISSSGGEGEGQLSSSSNDSVSPIAVQNYRHSGEQVLKYYNLQGQPLGNAKPRESGVYIVKNIKTGQVQKVVVK